MARLEPDLERRLLAALRLRRHDSLGTPIDSAALYVGTVVLYCCRNCGALADSLPDDLHSGIAQTRCLDCVWLVGIGFDFKTGSFQEIPPLSLADLDRFFDYAETINKRFGQRLSAALQDDGRGHLDNPKI